MENKQIVIFDGECGFCNNAVLFIAKRDTENKFLFVSNFSKRGRKILTLFELNQIANKTLILVMGDNYFIEGEAIKKIAKKIKISVVLRFILRLTPSLLLNFGYSIFSKYRKRMAKNNQCQIPSNDILNKFIL